MKKRLSSLVLALVMGLVLTVPALAAEASRLRGGETVVLADFQQTIHT